MSKVTRGSCPVCGDCKEADVEIEHALDGWSGRRMHRYDCPDCGEHSAIVLYDCPDCPPRREPHVARNESGTVE